jgi:hypothetical protein
VRVRLAILVALLLGLAGCVVPSSPDARDWRRSARQSVGDVASEVETARTTLRQLSADRFVGRYAIVLLVDAEEAAGQATDSVTTRQPPRVEQARYDEVSAALGDATDLLADARIAVTRGSKQDYPDLVEQLGTTGDELADLEEQLTRAPAGGSR